MHAMNNIFNEVRKLLDCSQEIYIAIKYIALQFRVLLNPRCKTAGRHVSDISFEILYIEFNKNPFNGGLFRHRRREFDVKYYAFQHLVKNVQ